jgi:sugar transferase (PEP-CTERM/EpsH1 system associated)
VSTARPLIAHVLYRLDIGGMENGVVNLINRMPQQYGDHAVIALTGATDFARRITRPNVPVHSIDKAPGKDPGAYLRLYRLLRKIKPTIVHTRNLGTVDCQAVAALAGVPGRIHGEHGWHFADLQGRAKRSILLRRVTSPFIHRYIAMSRDLVRWLSSVVGIDEERITHIYNGVDAERFSPQAAPAADLPWSRAVARPFIIGTVGRLEPTKNQGLLLRAFQRLLELVPYEAPRLALIMAGAGPGRAELQRAVDAAGLAAQVWLPGARNDVAAIMRSLDVFVLPSLNEGISNTILEAMACGRPVLAGRVGGNPELVLPGTTGELFDVGEPEDLARQLARYVAEPDLVRRQGEAGRERVVRGFSLDAMVAGYAGVYEKLSHQRV